MENCHPRRGRRHRNPRRQGASQAHRSGDPGFGKSLLTISMASTVTNEAKWPDCGEHAPFGSVVLLSAEDDDGDTVKPRLMAAQADESKVHSLSSVIELPNGRRGISLDKDIEILAKAIETVPDCRLLVIDPISAFMGNVDSHNVADVRGVLSELADLAQRRQFAVLYVTHLNKGKGTPMSRVSGSGAFVAAARSAMLVGRDPQDPKRRVLTMLKANLSTESSGVAYRIQSNESGLPVIGWEAGPVDLSPEDLLGHESGFVHRERGDAKEWLRKTLANGPVDSVEIEQLALNAGHRERTLSRAKKELGVKSRRVSGEGIWQWYLPDQHCQTAPHNKPGIVGTVGTVNGQGGQGCQDGQSLNGGQPGNVDAANGKSLIDIRLIDGTQYNVPLEFIKDLTDQFPQVDVVRELSNCAAWHGMNPDGRENEQGIKRHILVGMKNRDDGLSMWQ